MLPRNIFDIASLPHGNKETFETILKYPGLHIEKIVSNGQTTPEGEWYDSDKAEWVVLLQGSAIIEIENGKQVHLTAGDHLLIEAHKKHRVIYTSQNPHCIWIGVHFNTEKEQKNNIT
jgi:cupin 2 domain-containing protein